MIQISAAVILGRIDEKKTIYGCWNKKSMVQFDDQDKCSEIKFGNMKCFSD